MRPIWALPTFFCLALFGQHVSRVALSESHQGIHAFAPSGELTLSAVRTQLEIQHAAGRSERGNLVVVHDYRTGLFFWHFAHDETGSYLYQLQSGIAAVYVTPSTVVDFNWPGPFFAKEFTTMADSSEAAIGVAMEEIEGKIRNNERRPLQDYKTVDLGPAIRDLQCGNFGDPDFIGRCRSENNRIVSVKQEGDNWRLILRNRWDQEVILDSKFNLVSTRRLPNTNLPEHKK